MTTSELQKAIEDAFSEVRFPQSHFPESISLRQANLLDDWDEDPAHHREARRQDHTSDWQDVPDDDLAKYALTYFAYGDDFGTKYYLPAFMGYSLRHWGEPNVLSALLFHFGEEKNQLCLLLSDKQRSAVEAFLRHTIEYCRNRWEVDRAERIHRKYWQEFRDWTL